MLSYNEKYVKMKSNLNNGNVAANTRDGGGFSEENSAGYYLNIEAWLNILMITCGLEESDERGVAWHV